MVKNPHTSGLDLTLWEQIVQFFFFFLKQKRSQDGSDSDGLSRGGNRVPHWVPQPWSGGKPPSSSVLLQVHHLSAFPFILQVCCHLNATTLEVAFSGNGHHHLFIAVSLMNVAPFTTNHSPSLIGSTLFIHCDSLLSLRKWGGGAT